MLSKEKHMEVLEAYDLTKSYRAAAQLTGVDPHTAARLVAARALGRLMDEEPGLRSAVAEAFVDKIAEWIERSGAKVRADVVHDKLKLMGYSGSERTTRRRTTARSPRSSWRAKRSRRSSTGARTRSPARYRTRCSRSSEPSCTRSPTRPTARRSASRVRSGGHQRSRSVVRATRCRTPWSVRSSGCAPPPKRW